MLVSGETVYSNIIGIYIHDIYQTYIEGFKALVKKIESKLRSHVLNLLRRAPHLVIAAIWLLP